MGAAGDMLTAALLELLPAPDEFVKELNALGIPGVHFQKETSVKCGITGTHMTVTVNGEEEGSHDHEHSHDEHGHGHDCHEHGHDHSHGCHDDNHDHSGEHDHSHAHHDDEHDHSHAHHGDVHDHNLDHHDHSHAHHHHHSSLHDIEHIIRGHLSLPEKVQNDVMAVYRLIAEAESHVHGVPVTEIHFHEVGTMDAIADITAVCMLIDVCLRTKSLSLLSMSAAVRSNAHMAFSPFRRLLRLISSKMFQSMAEASGVNCVRLPVRLC